MVEHASLPVPPSHPDGWVKPDYSKLAEANAAADKKLEDQQAAFGVMPDAESVDDGSHEMESDTVDSDSPESDTVEGVVEEAAIETGSAEVVTTDTASDAASSLPGSDADSASTTESIASSDGATGAESAELPAASKPASSSEAAAHMPPIPTEPLQQTPLSIDAERLARSWQVGREKTATGRSCVAVPFADERDFRYPVPLISKMPRLDTLKPGDMLQALVLSVTDFGVFAELGPECNGLIHISRLSNKFLEDPHQFVQAGI